MRIIVFPLNKGAFEGVAGQETQFSVRWRLRSMVRRIADPTNFEASRSPFAPPLKGGCKSGFTLIEVLLALLIFVGSAAMLFRLVQMGQENAEYARLQSEGLLIAEGKMEELVAGALSIQDQGKFPIDDQPGWEWTLETQSTDVANLWQLLVRAEFTGTGIGHGVKVELTRLWFDEVAATPATTTDSTSSGATTSSSTSTGASSS